MNFINKLFNYTVKSLFIFVLLIIIALAIMAILEIRLNVNYLNKPVELAVEKVVGRDFSMQGDVVLIPTLWPTLEITDVSISNPEGYRWSSGETFAHFGRLRLQLGLIPLLSGELHVADVIAEDINLNLETDKQGHSSWEFDLSNDVKKTDTRIDAKTQSDLLAQNSSENQTKNKNLFYFKSLDYINLKDINIHFVDQSIDSSIRYQLANLDGHINSSKGIEIAFDGLLNDQKYSGKLTSDGFDALKIRGKQWPVSISMNFSGTKIDFDATLIRGTRPEISASLVIGETLAWLGIIKGLNLNSKHLSIQARIKGKNLAEMITGARLNVLLKDAAWQLKDRNTSGSLLIRINQGLIKVEPNQVVQIDLDGFLADAKMNIAIRGAKAIDYTRKKLKKPLTINIRTLGSRLQLKTRLSQDINVQNLGFNMLFEGKDLSDLNTLIHADLPPVGPYQLRGFFGLNKEGYRIKNLGLTVKNSHLKGNLHLNTRRQPLFLKVSLNSKQIQLNDFDVGSWSAVDKQEKVNKKADKAEPRAKITQNSAHKTVQKRTKPEKVYKLLSYENLVRYDINLKMSFDRLLSGKDYLGSGKTSLELKKAKLTLDLEELKLPGGSAKAEFSYKAAKKKTIDVALKTRVEQFNYGILARRIDPDSKVGGLLSIGVDLASKKAENLDSLLTNSEGYIDFSWEPEAMNADLFELWAVNLITSILKSADKEKTSKVNCVIGRFVFNKGRMHQKVVFADTTRMQMVGEVEANFKNRTIKVRVVPQAKKAEFFSLATPVSVSGSFDKFSLSVNPLGLTKTVVSFVTSPIHVPVRRLFNKALPEDGKEACKAMREVAEKMEE